MKRTILIIFFLLSFCFISSGQSTIIKDFQPACDSLGKMILERQEIRHGKLALKSVMKENKEKIEKE